MDKYDKIERVILYVHRSTDILSIKDNTTGKTQLPNVADRFHTI